MTNQYKIEFAPLTGRTHYTKPDSVISIIEVPGAEYPFLVVKECVIYARTKSFKSAESWAKKVAAKEPKQ